jgi:protein-disulfide isomerase
MARETSDTTKVLSYIVVIIMAFVGGFAAGNWPLGGDDGASTSASASSAGAAAKAGGSAGDSSKIPIGNSPVKGPDDAPVTIVEFSDFQCPFCSKGEDRLKKVRENFGEKVKVVFKHYPLPFHKQAKEAAYAAMAAGEQGKFWAMHDLLFKNQKKFADGKMKEMAISWAKQIDGLDVDKFKKAYSNNQSEYDKQIQKDQKLGRNLGVKGTPHFFINGERLSGAQPYSRFESVINSKLDQADKMLQGSVSKSELYAKAVQKNYEEPKKKPSKKKGKKKQQTKVEYVPVSDDDPVAGAEEDYLVTLVEFSDFECPFCEKAYPTVNKIKENYGDKVRVVWKDNPLPFHKQAKPAARAALAAQMQGEFWAMHDLLFKNQKKLGQDGIYEQLASQIGLNMSKFKSDMNSEKAKKMLDEDMTLAKKVGAGGTPNFWINGVNVVGAQPYSKFKTVLDQQIERATQIKEEEGVSGDKLYKQVVELNKKKVGSDSGGGSADSGSGAGAEALSVGDSPVKGPKDAPVTIYEFSDFECPYCKKAHSTLQPILDEYEGKVKVVYKNYPLPFHKNAKGAAKAALAAQEQGKFWEMYDLLFKNQKKLGQGGLYEDLASQIGLNMSKFKSDMEKSAYDKQIKQDMALGKKVGVKGTPAYYIGDKRLVGAQPASKFKTAIEDALEGN